MTVTDLSIVIAIAIALQLAVFAAVAFQRHWVVYQNLKFQAVGFDEGLTGEPYWPPQKSPAALPTTLPWEGYRDFCVSRKVFEDESQSICSFHLVPTDGHPLPDFKPGQFLTFQIEVADPNSGGRKSIVRCYSLSDQPGIDHYRISVKRVLAPAGSPDLPPGLASSCLHNHVQEGDVLATRAPSGHFFLEPGVAPVVLIAGGIGITPMLSMLNAELLNGSKREIWLFYGLHNSSEHIMKRHLESLAREHSNFRLRVCYSKPLPTDAFGIDYQHQGHVDINLLRLSLSLRPYHFYVCGPRVMMETIVPTLENWGIADQHIHYEAFGPASLTKQSHHQQPNQANAQAITVTFKKSGRSFSWEENSGSLLEFAESHGIRIDSGCRAGSCGSCQTVIEDGEVDYSHAPDFDAEPGTCLLCSARPKRNLILSA